MEVLTYVVNAGMNVRAHLFFNVWVCKDSLIFGMEWVVTITYNYPRNFLGWSSSNSQIGYNCTQVRLDRYSEIGTKMDKMKQIVKKRVKMWIARAKRVIARNFGLRVTSNEYDGNHYILSTAEAYEWMACYPAHTEVNVYNVRTGIRIAARIATP